MTGSKSVQHNGGKCKYVIKKGKREGDICDAPCRGDFCKNHNSNRQIYVKKYTNKKAIVNLKDVNKLRLRKLKKMQIGSSQKYKQVEGLLKSYLYTHKKWHRKGNSLVQEWKTIKHILDRDYEVSEKIENQIIQSTTKVSHLWTQYITLKQEPTIKEREKFNKKLEKLLVRRNHIMLKIKQYGEYINIIESKMEMYKNKE